MRRQSLIALIAALGIAACETVPPPPPPPPPQAGPNAYVYRSADFAWSAIPGANRIDGHVVYRQGATPYLCTNAALIPETPFSARRMITLYGSAVGAIVPVAEVQARTTPAPDGFNEFVKTTTCDAQGRFSFSGLPDGSWFVLTAARPVSGAGPQMAVMKRVVTRGGRPVTVDL
ncbi:MAG: putative lipoprotein [Caulobacteraceae bacterium]|nr:putative lipoprotein [Caulobacteraceae bacterium]